MENTKEKTRTILPAPLSLILSRWERKCKLESIVLSPRGERDKGRGETQKQKEYSDGVREET